MGTSPLLEIEKTREKNNSPKMGSNKARKSTHNKTKKVVKATLGKAKVVAIEATKKYTIDQVGAMMPAWAKRNVKNSKGKMVKGWYLKKTRKFCSKTRPTKLPSQNRSATKSFGLGSKRPTMTTRNGSKYCSRPATRSGNRPARPSRRRASGGCGTRPSPRRTRARTAPTRLTLTAAAPTMPPR